MSGFNRQQQRIQWCNSRISALSRIHIRVLQKHTQGREKEHESELIISLDLSRGVLKWSRGSPQSLSYVRELIQELGFNHQQKSSSLSRSHSDQAAQPGAPGNVPLHPAWILRFNNKIIFLDLLLYGNVRNEITLLTIHYQVEVSEMISRVSQVEGALQISGLNWIFG